MSKRGPGNMSKTTTLGTYLGILAACAFQTMGPAAMAADLQAARADASQAARAEARAAPNIAIVGGTVIDGNGGRPIENATVLVKGDRIVAIGSAGAVDVPADAKRYDASGKFILPGFIDLHMHLVYPRDGHQPSGSLSTLSALNFMEH